MTTLDQIAVRIIKEQELVIGPLAWSEAGKVSGITVLDAYKGEIALEGADKKDIVNRLVAQYERLFGRTSHEVCRGAVASLIADMSPAEVPSSLLV